MNYEQYEKEKEQQRAKQEAEKKQMSGTSVGCLVVIAIAFLLTLLGIEDVGSGLAFLIFIIAIGAGVYVANQNKKKTATAVDSAANQVVKSQATRKTNMEIVENGARSKGFVFSKKVNSLDNRFCLALDIVHQKFLVSENSSFSILTYDQLVSYELLKDGSSVISGDATGAILGGVLFGTAGAVIGAAGSNKAVNSICNEMYLSIVDKNAHRYKLFFINEATPESSEEFRIATERAREMLSILDVVGAANKNEIYQQSRRSEPNANKQNEENEKQSTPIDKFEAIKKYKELLDMGIISQEEFEQKKKQLLN